jgi:hypothetical protein
MTTNDNNINTPAVERPEHQRPTPIRIASASASGSVLTVGFQMPIVLRGTPNYATDVAGAQPVSAQLADPMTLELTFDAAIDAATELTIPFEDPAVRHEEGGFVADTLFPLAA